MKPLKRPQWLPVVAGIIRREKKVLLGQRPLGKSLAGLWEFPGGKIELGETPEQALRRELKEELDLDVEVGPLKVVTSHNYGDTGVVLIFYEVNYWRGEPKPLYHADLKWVGSKELREKAVELPEANRTVLDQLLKILES
jgi:8-oxo-dGTP diphosphatase